MNMRKKRLYSIITIFVSLPLAIVGASQQSMLMGGFFGSLLALAIDEFIASFESSRKVFSDNNTFEN